MSEADEEVRFSILRHLCEGPYDRRTVRAIMVIAENRPVRPEEVEARLDVLERLAEKGLHRALRVELFSDEDVARIGPMLDRLEAASA